MARYSWRERPLEDEPMCKVVKRTFGDGKVRFVLMFYDGVTFADYEEKRHWSEGKSYKREDRATRIALENARWMRRQVFTDEPMIGDQTNED